MHLKKKQSDRRRLCSRPSKCPRGMWQVLEKIAGRSRPSRVRLMSASRSVVDDVPSETWNSRSKLWGIGAWQCTGVCGHRCDVPHHGERHALSAWIADHARDVQHACQVLGDPGQGRMTQFTLVTFNVPTVENSGNEILHTLSIHEIRYLCFLHSFVFERGWWCRTEYQ